MCTYLTFIFNFMGSFIFHLWIIITTIAIFIITIIIIRSSRKPVICFILKMVFHFIIKTAWVFGGGTLRRTPWKFLFGIFRWIFLNSTFPPLPRATSLPSPPPFTSHPTKSHKKIEWDNQKNHPRKEKGRISYMFNKSGSKKTQMSSSSPVSP